MFQSVLAIVVLAVVICLILDALTGRGSRESRRRITSLKWRLEATEQKVAALEQQLAAVTGVRPGAATAGSAPASEARSTP